MIMNMKPIFTVINTTYMQAVVKIRPKKLQAFMGFELMTFAIPVQCSTNWANISQLGAGHYIGS